MVDLLIEGDILQLRTPEAGKILTCLRVGEVAQPRGEVFEVTTVGTPTRELFIAYRRADSAGHAGRLNDRLARDFGAGQIFKDIETLPPGVDFPQYIRKMLRRTASMVVVIGPQWLTLSNERGLRIFDPNDLHREEIRTALERDIPVFPALVNGTQMPAPGQLPDDIRALSHRHAVEISDRRWQYNLDELSAAVACALEASPRRRAFLEQLKSREGGGGWQWIADDPTGGSKKAPTCTDGKRPA